MKKSTLKSLIAYIKPYGWQFFAVLLFSILTVLFQILIPIQIGHTVNLITSFGEIDRQAILHHILILLLYAVLAALSQYLQHEFSNQLTYRMTREMRLDVFNQIQDLPLSYIDIRSHGDIISIAVNDVDLVGNGLLQSFTALFTGLATILGVLFMMLSINVSIGLVVVILTPISVVVSSIIASKSYHRFQEQMNLRGEIYGFVNEMVDNQQVIRGLNYQERSMERMTEINSRLHVSGFWSQLLGAIINPTTRLINSMVYGAVGLTGAFAVLNGSLSVGLFTSFLAYANQYTKPFNDISSVINELQTSFAAAERIFDFLAQPAEEPSRNHFKIEDPQGRISIRDLFFSYVKSKPLIQDFNIEVEAGQTVAIVGPTGAGKSTIINLLMRFYDQDAGGIFIDGVNTLDMHRDDVRLQFGMVLQDSWVFAGTVRENIVYGKPDASDEEVIAAAKKANIHETIMRMENAYDTFLEEGGRNISSGQQQLLNITRIMLMNPEMLILDEATSSIDTLTEKKVQEAFDVMMDGRTTFIVAHRLSTIQNADIILVMDQGQIVEQGNHESLLNKQGKYYQLYQSQFDHLAYE